MSAIVWPVGLEPAGASIYAINDGHSRAPRDAVWSWLVRPDQWPTYYRNARRPRPKSGSWPEVALGSTFTGMPLGLCRLCLQERELHRSHVLPAFAYRRVRDGAPQHIHASGETVSYSNTEFKEHLLCGDCEQRFSRIEAEIALLVAEGDAPMPWLSDIAVDPVSPSGKVGKSSSTKNDLIARFAISVVWRGAVSALKTNLGPYEERFRAFLLDDGAAFPDNTRLFVSLITGKTEGVNLQRTASLPKRSRLGGSFQHWFMCCGVTFSVIVGKTPPRDFDDACFVRTNGRVFLTGQDEMIERLAPVVSNRRVGKLARERKPGA